MSSGEWPIGAAKGKQPNTEALCQPPSPQRQNGKMTKMTPGLAGCADPLYLCTFVPCLRATQEHTMSVDQELHSKHFISQFSGAMPKSVEPLPLSCHDCDWDLLGIHQRNRKKESH